MKKIKFLIPLGLGGFGVLLALIMSKSEDSEQESEHDAPSDAGRSRKEVAEEVAAQVRREQAKKAANARWAKKKNEQESGHNDK